MTLVELLVATGIGIAVLSIASSFAVGVKRAWLNADRRSQADQSALVVISRVRAEVRTAQAGTLLPLPQQNALLLVSEVGTLPGVVWDATGEILWQSKVLLYLDGHAQVRYQRVPLSPPTPQPAALTPADFQPAPTDGVLARYVQTFQAQSGGPGLILVSVTTNVEGQTCQLLSSALTVSPTGL